MPLLADWGETEADRSDRLVRTEEELFDVGAALARLEAARLAASTPLGDHEEAKRTARERTRARPTEACWSGCSNGSSASGWRSRSTKNSTF